MSQNQHTSYEQWSEINGDGPNSLYKIGEMAKEVEEAADALIGTEKTKK